MKKIYKLNLFIIIILFAMVMFIANDYVKFKKVNNEINDEAIVLSDGDLSINFSSGNAFYIKKTDDGFVMEKKFSVTNMGKSTVYYTIAFNDIDYNVAESENVVYKLNGNNGGAVIDDALFPHDASEVTEAIGISPDTTQNYVISIKHNGNISEEDYLKGIITVKKKNDNDCSFSEIILADNQIKKALTVPGKEAAITDEGLIAGNDDDGITYYFRGNVKNNYVKFADKLWRIVRINGDNTIRLVLDGSIESSYAYNTNTLDEGDNDYYMLSSFEDATIKNELDNWYNDNIKSNAKYLVNSKFCIDKNISREDDQNSFYNSYIRVIEDKNPLHNCIGSNISSNIGLMSVDEVLFAGGVNNSENTNYYLYNSEIDSDWWLLSPASVNSENVVKVFVVNGTKGSIESNGSISIERELRPVINIRDNVDVTGTGTKDDPYVIQ